MAENNVQQPILQDGVYTYNGSIIKASNLEQAGENSTIASVFVDDDGALHIENAENLEIIDGKESKDTYFLKNSTLKQATTNEGDIINIDEQDESTKESFMANHTGEGITVIRSEDGTCKKYDSNGNEIIEEDAEEEQNTTEEQEIATEENTKREPLKPGEPDQDRTQTTAWIPGSKEDNCLWNIVKNHYPNLLSNQTMAACKQLAEANNFNDTDFTIISGQELKLPTLTTDENGKVTGFEKIQDEMTYVEEITKNEEIVTEIAQ